jgi:GcvH upstream region-like protein
MLQLLRRYQKFFFIIITVVVVITFSFFGTYQSIGNGSLVESKVLFKSIDGEEITQHFLKQMNLYLSTNSKDKLFFNGPWGYNFLNDGVVQKNFFETGMASILVKDFLPGLQDDFDKRLSKEKNYKPYSHPQIKYLNAEMAWKFFAPNLKKHLNTLQFPEDKGDMELFNARVDLYLEQKKFTPDSLRQVLQYQENQNSWVTPDPNLPHQDLAIFRYHTIEEWFGPNFLTLVNQFIINSAVVAKEKGYFVSKEEVKADMLRLAEIQYQKQKEALVRYSINNSEQYLRENLQRMGIEESVAIEIWKKVMLFKRYFEEVGYGVFESPIAYQGFDAFAGESVKVEQYQFPNQFQFSMFKTLQRFQIYLNYVALPTKNILELPQEFYSPEQVKEKSLGLVQERYLLKISEVNKHALEILLTVKETWDWELKKDHWDMIVKEYPRLSGFSSKTKNERYQALEQLPEKVRLELDSFARGKIVDAIPNWVEKELEKADSQVLEVALNLKNPTFPFPGLNHPEKLLLVLQKLKNAEKENNLAEVEALINNLRKFTTNDVEFYSIEVLDKAEELEIVTLEEAVTAETIDEILNEKLETYYSSYREKEPKAYQISEGKWKPLPSVENEIAESFFKDIIEAVSSYMVNVEGYKSEDLAPGFVGEFAASHRLFPYAIKERQQLIKGSNNKKESSKNINEDKLSLRKPLDEQWYLEKSEETFLRSARSGNTETLELFAVKNGAWSRVFGPSTGDIRFFKVLAYKPGPYDDVKERLYKGQQLLSNEVQQFLMDDVLKLLKDKKVIGFQMMNDEEEIDS